MVNPNIIAKSSEACSKILSVSMITPDFVLTLLTCREEEERGNAMKQLENRTLDSKREMDIMAALDEMQSLNARHARVDTDAALAALKRSAMEDEAAGQIDLDEEDEAVLRQMLEQVTCCQAAVSACFDPAQQWMSAHAKKMLLLKACEQQ